MTARDAGGIACRIFAAYLLYIAFESFLGLMSIAGIDLRYGGLGTSEFGPQILRGSLLLIAAAIFWAKSRSFWPSDSPIAGDVGMDAARWTRLGLMLLGVWFLLIDGPVPLLAILKGTLQTSIKWPEITPGQLFDDSVRSLVAIGMIVFGARGLFHSQAGNETSSQISS